MTCSRFWISSGRMCRLALKTTSEKLCALLCRVRSNELSGNTAYRTARFPILREVNGGESDASKADAHFSSEAEEEQEDEEEVEEEEGEEEVEEEGEEEVEDEDADAGEDREPREGSGMEANTLP